MNILIYIIEVILTMVYLMMTYFLFKQSIDYLRREMPYHTRLLDNPFILLLIIITTMLWPIVLIGSFFMSAYKLIFKGEENNDIDE